jgi:RHS repeat-associated protein
MPFTTSTPARTGSTTKGDNSAAGADQLPAPRASGKLLETTDPGTTNHDYIYFDGRRIARHDSSGAVYYLYDDANGSLRTATDASGTQLCWADYYPFGEPAAGTGCSVDSYQFAGLYADATGEDGNYSAAHRRYNYSYYRWLSPDPDNAGADVGDSQSWDMYSYVGDNPTTGTDPGGEDYKVCQDGVNGASTNCTVLTDRQYDVFVEKNKDTLSFAGSKIFANGTQIGTTEYIPTLNAFATGVFSSPQFQAASGTINNYVAPALGLFMLAAAPAVLEGSLGLPAAGLDLPKAPEPVISPRSSPPPDLENLSIKIQKQMASRGWTPQDITDAYGKGEAFPATNKLRGGTPATRYVNPGTGKSVVIDNATGEVIHVGKAGYKY